MSSNGAAFNVNLKWSFWLLLTFFSFNLRTKRITPPNNFSKQFNQFRFFMIIFFFLSFQIICATNAQKNVNVCSSQCKRKKNCAQYFSFLAEKRKLNTFKNQRVEKNTASFSSKKTMDYALGKNQSNKKPKELIWKKYKERMSRNWWKSSLK